MKLKDQSITEFTKLIASTAPAPGGGGASAAVAAIGIALGDMVGEFTVGKKKYAEVEEEIKALMLRAEQLRLRFLELIDKDAEDFVPLSEAYAIPKDAPGRDEELERCLKLAAATPLEIFDLSCEAIDIQYEFAHKGSTLLISDAATGVSFCLAALKGAAVNVKVNTKLMKDREYARKIDAHIDEASAKYEAKAEEVFSFVYDRYQETK